MKNIIYITFLIILPIIIFSCNNESEFPTKYIIENTTERNIEIKFYDRSNKDLNGNSTLVDSRSIAGKGIIYHESRIVQGPSDSDSPLEIFKADSLAIFFDNEKVESHYDGIPSGNSLTFIGDYIGMGNTTYTYKISEKNYENSRVCDGNCD